MGCSRRGRVPSGGAPHLVARADSNAEPGLGEVVQDVRTVGDVRGVGLELAAGGAVRVRVLVDPALEETELVLRGVQAAPVGVGLQGDQELVIHGTVDAAIGDVDSASACDQEREEHQDTFSLRDQRWFGSGVVRR